MDGSNTPRAEQAPDMEPDIDAVHESRLKPLYKQMILIRKVEEILIEAARQGRLPNRIHTCIGQEACAVGVVSALDPSKDIICSNHRGHGHFLAYCGDVQGLVAGIVNPDGGEAPGSEEDQVSLKSNYFSNGILGGMSPVAAGMAAAEKLKGTHAISVVFHGDGALGEGIIYETMNLAALWELPLLIVIENNQYAGATPVEFELAGTPEARARSFGVAVTEVDGNDVLAVREAASRVIQGVRRGQRPAMLYLRTFRLGPHVDANENRDPAEIQRHRSNDPIENARGLLDPIWCEDVERSTASFARRVIDEAVSP